MRVSFGARTPSRGSYASARPVSDDEKMLMKVPESEDRKLMLINKRTDRVSVAEELACARVQYGCE